MRALRGPQEFVEEDVSSQESFQREESPFRPEDFAPHSTEMGNRERAQRNAQFEMTSSTKAQIATFTAVLSTLPMFPENLYLNKARQRWKAFSRQFEDICELRTDLDDKQKALLLKAKGGVAIQSIIRQLGDSVAKAGYSGIKSAIDGYYNKHSVVQVDIEKFRAIRQTDSETFAAFMSRLRNQAEMCDFKNEEHTNEHTLAK